MTWSIIARDEDGTLGIAIASRAFAVGALCPYVRSRTGAVATQALVNPHLGPLALDFLAYGASAEDALSLSLARDIGQAQRQIHLIDAHGNTAAHTGADCIETCGHVAGPHMSVAGNMLANERVLAETARAYLAAHEKPFALRLIEAMQAGQDAGGDRRGQQAAALLVYRDEDYPLLDIRVDDHLAPLTELRRLYEVSFERFQGFLGCLPSRARPEGVLDRAEIDAEIERFVLAHRTPPT